MGYFNQINFIITLVMVMMVIETMGGINKTKEINKKINKTKTPPVVLKMEPNNPLEFTNYINITNSNVGINLFGDIEKYHGDRYENGLLKMFNFNNGKITNVLRNITRHNIKKIGNYAESKNTNCLQNGIACNKYTDCCSQFCKYKKCVCVPDGVRMSLFINSAECCSKYSITVIARKMCIGVPIPLLVYLEQLKWWERSLNNSTISEDSITKTTPQQEQQNNNNNATYPVCSVNETKEMYNRKKAAEPENKYRWTRGLFVYITSEFSQSSVEIILNGLLDIYWEFGTCLSIFIWPTGTTPTKEHVIIRKVSEGCSVNVIGKSPFPPQYVNLGPGCVDETLVIHEVFHALGLFHEQARPDRDKYINIHKENIKAGELHNFERRDNTLTFGAPYGYDSIMYYSSKAFNSNGKNTITKKDGGVIGYNYKISHTDRIKLRHMYCIGE